MRIGIQKSGRLRQCSEVYFAGIGWESAQGEALLLQDCIDDPDIQFVYTRQSDLPKLLEQGVLDVAIVGQNIIREKPADCDVLQLLDCGICRLVISIPNEKNWALEDLNGKTIATSYPNSLKRYLDRQNIEVDIVELSGSVEIAPAVGLADAVCDIVQTGKTLAQNGLKTLETVYKSQAVLISSPKISTSDRKKLEGRIQNANVLLQPVNA